MILARIHPLARRWPQPHAATTATTKRSAGIPAAFGDRDTAGAGASATHSSPGAGAPSRRPTPLPLMRVCRLARRHALLHEVHAHLDAYPHECRHEVRARRDVCRGARRSVFLRAGFAYAPLPGASRMVGLVGSVACYWDRIVHRGVHRSGLLVWVPAGAARAMTAGGSSGSAGNVPGASRRVGVRAAVRARCAVPMRGTGRPA